MVSTEERWEFFNLWMGRTTSSSWITVKSDVAERWLSIMLKNHWWKVVVQKDFFYVAVHNVDQRVLFVRRRHV